MHWRHSSRREIAGETVAETVARNVRLADGLDEPDLLALHRLSAHLIRTKRWEGIGDIDLDDEILVTIAANAALPLLRLDVSLYGGVRAILVRPTTRVSTGPRAGPIPGSFSEAPLSTIGEAAAHAGPLAVSWDAVLADSLHPEAGRNVVIHEFAHKIDGFDGSTDGVPPVRGPSLERWSVLMQDEFRDRTVPPERAALRDYAWTNPAEFFAVATEAFFCVPRALRGQRPALYRALASFFDQDPALRR